MVSFAPLLPALLPLAFQHPGALLQRGAPSRCASSPSRVPQPSLQQPPNSGDAPLLPWVRPALVGASAAAVVAGGALMLPGVAHASILDSAFVQSTSLIFISELGDKTFFIAALLAARASKLLTFAGCAGALALMTVVSVLIGQIFHQVPAGLTRGLPLDDYVAIASFVFFGIKAILDAAQIEEDGAGIAEESEEAEETLEQSGLYGKSGWPLVLEACTLTIAAEVGDRSQIATIALAAAQNPYLVAFGAIAGHCAATGMAVLGGSFISKYLSERVIGFVGGGLFLVFALTTAVGLF
mmetsp:Transcript_23447/g.69016  ORF Transcript_23447/g.69016 Transcript_23447/m.69016 type:complete len:297 (+) Transcript_23447:56-946(+)